MCGGPVTSLDGESLDSLAARRWARVAIYWVVRRQKGGHMKKGPTLLKEPCHTTGARRRQRKQMDYADGQEACGLEHMPPEVRLHIVGFVDRVGDMASALMASRFFDGRSAVEMAIAMGAVHTGRILEAGAPLDIVQKVIARRERPLGRGFIECAVLGGRMDVLHFVCDRVAVRLFSIVFRPLFSLIKADNDWTVA